MENVYGFVSWYANERAYVRVDGARVRWFYKIYIGAVCRIRMSFCFFFLC